MAVEKKTGRFTVISCAPVQDEAALLRRLAAAPVIAGKGRAGIRTIEIDGHRLVARQYTHGGLFRIFTGDRFFGGRRAIAEAEITEYLYRCGFPIVKPFCVVTERRVLTRRLYLVTFLEEGAVDLLQHIREASSKQRLRIARRLGEAFWRLERAGVFHPDLHLRNVVITGDGRLVFLDFDRARRRAIGRKDMQWMFKRLGRFVDKMERQGEFSATGLEKAVFLRAYARLAHYDPTADMARSAERDHLRHRMGWLLESLLYRKRKRGAPS
jgi:3-deoxy-D-manno-octulosonic acid kinase